MQNNCISYKQFKLNLNSRRLYVYDDFISLRNMEFLLIEFFMKNAEMVLNRSQLLECVWDRNIFCVTNTVDVHISSLRKKIKKLSDQNLIHTVHCIGYMLEA